MQHQNPTQILNSGNYQMFFSDYFKGCKKIILSHYFLTLKKIQLFATAASLKSSLKASRDKMGKKYRHKKTNKQKKHFCFRQKLWRSSYWLFKACQGKFDYLISAVKKFPQVWRNQQRNKQQALATEIKWVSCRGRWSELLHI